ncbi:unnamed protein product [Macrosiphum euphorbiae]|uniref:MADF domain-containing protein n=1 Tax=Macrosiphum euphorbiae TaxID=13131 RepID=A0AAV0WPT3_9HEMI|nr:unnamed protein product [Macrosiphum euphorbiae]
MDVNKDFWEDLIELYRNHSCLWNVKCKDYSNKIKRNSSYEILLKKLKEIYPEATTELLKKKINNIRTTFRRELKKVESSMCTGSSTENVYEPSIWYYDLLYFTAQWYKCGIFNLFDSKRLQSPVSFHIPPSDTRPFVPI